MLHTVNKSPFQNTTLSSCLEHAEDGSAVLLIEDGVYAAVGDSSAADALKSALSRLKVFALGPDLDARGMDPSRIMDGVDVVDYGGFVDLVVEHGTAQSWL